MSHGEVGCCSSAVTPASIVSAQRQPTPLVDASPLEFQGVFPGLLSGGARSAPDHKR
jgi:hypothetical protein